MFHFIVLQVCVFFFKVRLQREKQREREREEVHLLVCIYMLTSPDTGTGGSQKAANSIFSFYVDGREAIPWASTCCFWRWTLTRHCEREQSWHLNPGTSIYNTSIPCVILAAGTNVCLWCVTLNTGEPQQVDEKQNEIKT